MIPLSCQSAPAPGLLTCAVADAAGIRGRVGSCRPRGRGLQQHSGGVLRSLLQRHPSALAPHSHPRHPLSSPLSPPHHRELSLSRLSVYAGSCSLSPPATAGRLGGPGSIPKGRLSLEGTRPQVSSPSWPRPLARTGCGRGGRGNPRTVLPRATARLHSDGVGAKLVAWQQPVARTTGGADARKQSPGGACWLRA